MAFFDDIDEDRYYRSFDEDSAKNDKYWDDLRDFYYRFRTGDLDFEELPQSQLDKWSQYYEEHLDCERNPEAFYGAPAR